ncbi:MAG: VOC family protein [SAR324 cluster bacterium]|nr:VOC family protein [SAR324 cluster bacterium]
MTQISFSEVLFSIQLEIKQIMRTSKIDHVAYITPDMEKTIRFYRDLLGMRLVTGIGHEGYRHYFFETGKSLIAFFEYEGAQPMEYNKFHGQKTGRPMGFDHISFTVESREDLFAMKDRLEAAGIKVDGAVDHGLFWSIYFFDPVSNLPLEMTWNFVELTNMPTMHEVKPLSVAEEGADPQPGHWPEVTNPTPEAKMTAHPGNGILMRSTIIGQGAGYLTEQAKAAGITVETNENQVPL